ncbi:MAG: hypothetical protein MJZ76_01930 [Bacteroidales bacterium]|nr:hypothetical protein [Bacteroidales bacterium]
MKKTLLLFTIFLFSISLLKAQDWTCPQIDCPGQCGAFVDANGDGFCDHGQLSSAQQAPKEATQKSEKANSDTQFHKKQTEKPIQEIENQSNEMKETDTTVWTETSGQDTTEKGSAVSEQKKKQNNYYPLQISLGTLILYLLTFILAKKEKIQTSTHRKIWNVVLMISATISGILGLIITYFCQYGYKPTCYRTIRLFHVEFGILLAIIAIFHIFWHLNYYKNIFKK